MKKILLAVMVSLIVLSAFLMLAPQPKADLEVVELWRVPIVDNTKIVCTDTGDVDGDSIEDLAILTEGNTVQIIKNDGTQIWSKPIPFDGGSVAIGDVDTDGKGEVFVFGRKGSKAIVYCFEHDGTPWWEFNGEDTRLFGYVALLNLDVDPQLEIFVTSCAWASYTHYALDTDGSVLWSFRTEEYGNQMVFTDVTGDGVEDIILATFQDAYVLDKSGSLIAQFPMIHPEVCNAYIMAGDITGDGTDDMAISYIEYNGRYFNHMYVIKNDSTLLWEKEYGREGFNLSRPLVVDIDDDTLKEVIVYGSGKMNAYDSDGTLLWEFGNSTFFQDKFRYVGELLHFDITRNLKEEIVFQMDQHIYALSLDGDVVLDFTLPNDGLLVKSGCGGRVEGREAPRYGEVADVNDDGFEELIIQEIIDGQYYVAALLIVVPKLQVFVGVKPDSLNLCSRGKWITAYIELPEGYDVNDINASTILLNDTVPVDPSAPTAVGDHDEDGIPDLMVKFDRAEITSYILANVNMTKLCEERFMTVTLTITVKLNDGTSFQGSDTIKIVMPMPRGLGKRAIPI